MPFALLENVQIPDWLDFDTWNDRKKFFGEYIFNEGFDKIIAGATNRKRKRDENGKEPKCNYGGGKKHDEKEKHDKKENQKKRIYKQSLYLNI